MRKIGSLFLALFIGFASFAASQISPVTPAPTFSARTRLVEVDVVVRGKNGPVTGLTQDDFTLLDNGKLQKISVFSIKGTQGSGQAVVPLPSGTVSNRVNRNGQEAGSSTIILIDRQNTSLEDQYYAQRKIVKYLEARRSQDRLAIYTLGGGLRVVQDLTDDPDRLTRAVNTLRPRNAKNRTLDVPGEFEKREPEMSGRALEEYTLLTASEGAVGMQHALEAIARHLSPVPGRKSLIWITSGFPLLIRTAHETKDFTEEMRKATRALNDANVALYPVDARGLVYGGMPPKAGGLTIANLDTMNYVAGQTGGRAFYADNGIDNLIEAAVEDSEVIYTLGFYPSQESQDGTWHNLKASVDRRGLSVRSREAYFASKAADPGQRPTLDELLHNTLDAAEIGIRLETTPDRSLPGVYKVRTIVDLHDVQMDHQGGEWVGTLKLLFYVEGAKSGWTVARKITVPEDKLADALEGGVVVDASIRLTEPTGQLRVAAQDGTTGAGGSVRVHLKAQ